MTAPEVLNAPEPLGVVRGRSRFAFVPSMAGGCTKQQQTMKGKLKQFVGEKRGVSPVIGVVLMVAVVVILAAVIGAFVLGLGGDQQTTPQASFSYDAASGTLTMSSGDAIDAGNLYVTHDGGNRGLWTASQGSASGTGDNANAVVAGDSATVDAQDTVKVIYDDGNGNTATLTSINVGNGGGGNGGTGP